MAPPPIDRSRGHHHTRPPPRARDGASARIGCTLTDNWQIDPEQSTSAIVVHHPEAKYFNI